MRKIKLDELPQLVNILKGEMSIIGPRPEVKEYTDYYEKDYQVILSVRPGLTDNAAIAYIDEEKLLAKSKDPHQTYVSIILKKKIELYNEYIEDISFLSDMRLIIKTIVYIVWSIVPIKKNSE